MPAIITGRYKRGVVELREPVGMWKDVVPETFIDGTRRERARGSRPPVDRRMPSVLDTERALRFSH